MSHQNSKGAVRAAATKVSKVPQTSHSNAPVVLLCSERPPTQHPPPPPHTPAILRPSPKTSHTALRELEEETGLPAGSVTIEAILPDWVTYDLPDHRALEQITRQFTLAESAMAVLREAGMVGNTVAQIKATKPAKREVQMHLCAQPPL